MATKRELYIQNGGFRDGGPYLDDVEREEAETRRAKIEDREPHYDNLLATAGTQLVTAAQLDPGYMSLPSQREVTERQIVNVRAEPYTEVPVLEPNEAEEVNKNALNDGSVNLPDLDDESDSNPVTTDPASGRTPAQVKSEAGSGTKSGDSGSSSKSTESKTAEQKK